MNKLIIILFVIGFIISIISNTLNIKELNSVADLMMYFIAGIAFGKAWVEEIN